MQLKNGWIRVVRNGTLPEKRSSERTELPRKRPAKPPIYAVRHLLRENSRYIMCGVTTVFKRYDSHDLTNSLDRQSERAAAFPTDGKEVLGIG